MWWRTSNCSPLLIHRPREDERLSWPDDDDGDVLLSVMSDVIGRQRYVKAVRFSSDDMSHMDYPAANIILRELRQLYKHRSQLQ